MKTRTIAILIALLTLGGVGIASARWFGAGPFGGPGHHGPEHMERMKTMIQWRIDDALGDVQATDAQRAQIKTITEDLFETGKAHFGEHKDGKAAFLAQLRSDTPNKEAVHALIDVRIESARKMAYAAADAAFEVHSVLTPEQRAELLDRIEAHHR